jgi:hypothetical protein
VMDHAALYMSRGDSGNPALYDPAGSYSASHGGGSGDLVTGDSADLAKFAAFHGAETAKFACKDTTPVQEQKNLDAIEAIGTDLGPAAPFECATRVSSIIAGKSPFQGVDKTFFPGNLYFSAGGQ